MPFLERGTPWTPKHEPEPASRLGGLVEGLARGRARGGLWQHLVGQKPVVPDLESQPWHRRRDHLFRGQGAWARPARLGRGHVVWGGGLGHLHLVLRLGGQDMDATPF